MFNQVTTSNVKIEDGTTLDFDIPQMYIPTAPIYIMPTNMTTTHCGEDIAIAISKALKTFGAEFEFVSNISEWRVKCHKGTMCVDLAVHIYAKEIHSNESKDISEKIVEAYRYSGDRLFFIIIWNEIIMEVASIRARQRNAIPERVVQSEANK